MRLRSQLYGTMGADPRLERRFARLAVALRRSNGFLVGVLIGAGVLSWRMLRREVSLNSSIVDSEVGTFEFFADGPTKRCGVFACFGVLSVFGAGRLRVAGVSSPSVVEATFDAAGARDAGAGVSSPKAGEAFLCAAGALCGGRAEMRFREGVARVVVVVVD